MTFDPDKHLDPYPPFPNKKEEKIVLLKGDMFVTIEYEIQHWRIKKEGPDGIVYDMVVPDNAFWADALFNILLKEGYELQKHSRVITKIE